MYSVQVKITLHNYVYNVQTMLIFSLLFLSGEKYVMTVFGVFNFGDQGNTACVNIYMHVMSKKNYFHLFFTFYYYSVHGDFFYQWYNIYFCHAIRGKQSIICHILTNEKCIFKWCACNFSIL